MYSPCTNPHVLLIRILIITTTNNPGVILRNNGWILGSGGTIEPLHYRKLASAMSSLAPGRRSESPEDGLKIPGKFFNNWNPLSFYVDYRNRLSADCVGASSVNVLKNKIDIYPRMAGYI